MQQGTNRTRMRLARLVIASIVVAGLPVSQAVFAPTAGAAVDVVVNGSFETGDFSGWQVQHHPCPFLPWMVTGAGHGSGFFAPTQPQDGVRVASNGFDGCPGRFAISQVVTLPAGTSEISWSDRYQWDMLSFGGPNAQARTGTVELLHPVTNAVLQTVATFSTGVGTRGDSGWVAHTVEIAGLGGQAVKVVFRQDIPQNFTGPGQYEVDGISIVQAAEPDTDGDGLPDSTDPCPNDVENDADEDGLCESDDPCPTSALNDADGDGICDTPAPTTKDECKNDGWRAFNNPTFRNQGQCVSLVASQGRRA